MTQYICHGIQCVFILNRSVMQPENKKKNGVTEGSPVLCCPLLVSFYTRAAYNTLVSNAMVEL